MKNTDLGIREYGVDAGNLVPGLFFMIMSELEKELLEEPVGVFDDLDTTLAPDEE